MLNFSLANQFLGNPFSCVNRDSKAESLSTLDNGCINTNDFTSRIEQWASRVTWINSCIRLNKINALIRNTDIATGTRRGTDNTDGYSFLQTQGISDRDRPLTWLYPFRTSQSNRWQVIALNLDNCDITGWIFPQNLTLQSASIRE